MQLLQRDVAGVMQQAAAGPDQCALVFAKMLVSQRDVEQRGEIGGIEIEGLNTALNSFVETSLSELANGEVLPCGEIRRLHLYQSFQARDCGPTVVAIEKQICQVQENNWIFGVKQKLPAEFLADLIAVAGALIDGRELEMSAGVSWIEL